MDTKSTTQPPWPEIMAARADLHAHSKHSNRPSEWFLRRIGAPESYVEPLDIYHRCRTRGMDFVTITDHNKIAGALEIAHLPGAFISSELTTYFPEDRVKLHLLVYNISEQQFADLSHLRLNLYELKDYIDQQAILHSLAHPLFRVDDRLQADHFEKLLLLFDRLEAINGSRDPKAANLLQIICRALTPALIDRLADKHDLAPRGVEPWRKIMTGGSDDHSGNYLAGAWTETPAATDLNDFLGHLHAARQQAGGASGNSLQLAHSFYKIAYSYYRDRFGVDRGAGQDLVGELLKQLLHENPATRKRPPVYRRLADRLAWAGRKRRLNTTELMLVDEIGRLFSGSLTQAAGEISQERSFQSSCRLCHHLSWKFAEQFLQKLKNGNFLEALQTVTALGPVALAIAPYLAAFATQHKDREFFIDLTNQWQSHGVNMVNRKRKRRLITGRRRAQVPADTWENIYLVCDRHPNASTTDTVSLVPVAGLDLGENSRYQPALPPFLEVFRRLEELDPDEVEVAAPDPLGLSVLIGCRLLRLKSRFHYRRNLAATASRLGPGRDWGELFSRYADWVATLADQIVVEDPADGRRLLENGLDGKIVLPTEPTEPETTSKPERSEPLSAVA
ncbi:MAG: hypothetical protein JXR89_02615 [Deltaproteobacteria bacterium]|nr:hypothetical protein [Deltaproteobacteria bacterium]